MLSLGARILFFVSSYLPLALSFAIVYLKNNFWVFVDLIVGIVVTLVLLSCLLGYVRSLGATSVRIFSSRRRDSDTLGYFATYLIPFALAPPNNTYAVLAMMVFFLVLGFVYINSNLLFVNPTMNMIGYHLFEVQFDEGGETYMVFVRGKCKAGQEMDVSQLDSGLYFQHS